MASQDGEEVKDEYMQFFGACDNGGDGRFNFEDLGNDCWLNGETFANYTTKLFEVMFDGVFEETGIIIITTDMKNTKPHINWQDHKISISSIFCYSSSLPVFTTPTVA